MPQESDRNYYLKREQQCRDAAASATDKDVARVHRHFAKYYREAASASRVDPFD